MFWMPGGFGRAESKGKGSKSLVAASWKTVVMEWTDGVFDDCMLYIFSKPEGLLINVLFTEKKIGFHGSTYKL